MGDGFLLDTSAISLLFNGKDPGQAEARKRLEQIGAAQEPVFIPIMAIAEIRFGMELAGALAVDERQALQEFFERYPILPLDHGAIEPYAIIRAKLLTTYGERKKRNFKQKHLHQLLDPDTRASLEIYERDLLIAAVAIQYNLVLITTDRAHGMNAICEAARLLEAEGKPTKLRVEYWPAEAGATSAAPGPEAEDAAG